MAETAKRMQRNCKESCHFATGTPVSVSGNYFFETMPVEPRITGTVASKGINQEGKVKVAWDVDGTASWVDHNDLLEFEVGECSSTNLEKEHALVVEGEIPDEEEDGGAYARLHAKAIRKIKKEKEDEIKKNKKDSQREESKEIEGQRKRKVVVKEDQIENENSRDEEEDKKEDEEEEEEEEEGRSRKKVTSSNKGKRKVGKKGDEEDKGKKRKVYERKVRTTVTIGKKASDKRKEKRQKENKEVEEENMLDFEEEIEEEEEEEEEEEQGKKKKEIKWKKGTRRVDPKGGRHIPGARLTDESSNLWDESSFKECFLTFLPVEFVKDVMLPATNKVAKEHGHAPFSYDEVIHVLGILYMMEVVKLPERRMYWMTEPDGFFPAMNFGKVMSLHRFEGFLNIWQFSPSPDSDQQVLDLISAVNKHLKEAVKAGEYLCIDESMIKSFHRDLHGKMKILRKPRPVGNELKTVSDASTHIVLHMELHEPKEDMAEKEYVDEFGATTACCLRITEYWKGNSVDESLNINQKCYFLIRCPSNPIFLIILP